MIPFLAQEMMTARSSITTNARQLAFVYAGFSAETKEGKQARIYGGKVLLCDSSLIKEKTMSKEKTEGLLAGERCGEKQTVSIASMRGMRFAELVKRKLKTETITI